MVGLLVRAVLVGEGDAALVGEGDAALVGLETLWAVPAVDGRRKPAWCERISGIGRGIGREG